MNHAKALILAAVSSDGLRETLRDRIPGAYFEVAADTAERPDDTECVLERVLELYVEHVKQAERRRLAAEAALAESRRSHLTLLPTPSPASPAASRQSTSSKGE